MSTRAHSALQASSFNRFCGRFLGHRVVGSLFLSVLLGLTGCVGGAWKTALKEDSPAGYYRFMRDHADSKYAGEARERLDYHKLKRSPTLAGFEAFKKKYPDSDLLSALQPSLEVPAFDQALAQGTSEAYRGFLAKFRRGLFSDRAEGNAVYVEAEGFRGNAALLSSFAQDYPESDFAKEAQRTAEAVAARGRPPITRVGLVLNVDASTPERKRVRTALLERILEMTERMGVEVVEVPSPVSEEAARSLPKARLEVVHAEKAVGHEAKAGELARPAVLGATRLVLMDEEGGEVIADRRFEVRVEDKRHVTGSSVLFSQAARKYWNDFFVPVASWRNDQSIRPEITMTKPVVDIQGVGDRAFVLYDNGSFDVIGLADPTEPVVLASYERAERLQKWSGIRVIGDRIVIFGEEGLEFVRFTGAGPVAEKTWERGQIGRILSIAETGNQLVIVGAKGMQILDIETGEIRRAMRRVIQSIGSTGETLVFVDGESIYVSSLALLAQDRVIAQMRLGRTFGPNHVRVMDQAAIVTGPGGVVVIDVKNPAKPKALAKLASREIGEIVDATRIRGRTFLLGQRGLQVLNRSLTGVEETIDVGDREHVTVMGRHLVTADDGGLRVVDATPWAAGNAPASKANRDMTRTPLESSGF
ncbi:MAG: hypothetical protein AB8G23_20835 [Myxococcota bacterium]